MVITDTDIIDLDTPTGLMRTHIFRPAKPSALPGGRYPGVLLYSEIFQLTGPIRRSCAFLAGHGFLVAAPEVYHELEPAGTVLSYTPEGSARGNAHKTAKALAAYDADAKAVIDFLHADPGCTGAVGTMGMCLGGHLAFRAALDPRVRAAACLYPTDLHKKSLGSGGTDDSLERCREIQAELLMIFGRQDPHIPPEGRRMVHDALMAADRTFEWHEFNAAHAFLRDEGNRYNPQLARLCWELVLDVFHRRLG
jgi:carboxymethylenebutenolidase